MTLRLIIDKRSFFKLSMNLIHRFRHAPLSEL